MRIRHTRAVIPGGTPLPLSSCVCGERSWTGGISVKNDVNIIWLAHNEPHTRCLITPLSVLRGPGRVMAVSSEGCDPARRLGAPFPQSVFVPHRRVLS